MYPWLTVSMVSTPVMDVAQNMTANVWIMPLVLPLTCESKYWTWTILVVVLFVEDRWCQQMLRGIVYCHESWHRLSWSIIKIVISNWQGLGLKHSLCCVPVMDGCLAAEKFWVTIDLCHLTPIHHQLLDPATQCRYRWHDNVDNKFSRDVTKLDQLVIFHHWYFETKSKSICLLSLSIFVKMLCPSIFMRIIPKHFSWGIAHLIKLNCKYVPLEQLDMQITSWYYGCII